MLKHNFPHIPVSSNSNCNCGVVAVAVVVVVIVVVGGGVDERLRYLKFPGMISSLGQDIFYKN